MFIILTDNIFKLWGLSLAKSTYQMEQHLVLPLHKVYIFEDVTWGQHLEARGEISNDKSIARLHP